MDVDAIIAKSVSVGMSLEDFDKKNSDKSVGKITYLKDVPTASQVFANFRKTQFGDRETDWTTKATEFNSAEVAWVNMQLPMQKADGAKFNTSIEASLAKLALVNPDSAILKKLENQKKLATFFYDQPKISKTAMMHIPQILARSKLIENNIVAGNSITVYGPWLKSSNAPRSFSPRLMKIVLLQFREGIVRLQKMDGIFDSRGAVIAGNLGAGDTMECSFSYDSAKDAIVLNHTDGVAEARHFIRACVSIDLSNYRKSFLKIPFEKMTREQQEVQTLFVRLWTFVLQNGWNAMRKANFTGSVDNRAKHGLDQTQVEEVIKLYPTVHKAQKPAGSRTVSKEWDDYLSRRRCEAAITHYYTKRMISLNRSSTVAKVDNHAMPLIDITV